MVKSKDLLEDLVLDDHKRRVDGIEGGLEILGRGTFVFSIEDDDGEVHTIRIPNSVYVPGLRYCLLSPQHWAQMANDHHPTPRGTRMENDDQHCILIWGQGRHRRSVPHSFSTNTPTFRTAPATSTYRSFVALHEAMEAQFHRREHVLQIPGLRPNIDEEFVAEENLLLDDVDKSPFESVTHDDETAPTSNQASGVEQKETSENVTRLGPLTFDLTPVLEASDRVDVVAADDQAELMRWHHRLGHLSFAKLKILAHNNEIPKKFAKVKPPTCAGCLYGAMTKVPWQGKDNAGEVFVATRPGQCVSVDQMISTQVGFIAQLKSSLPKKCYKAATIFVDHFSRLQYVHLMTSLSSEETVAAKLAFERFADQNGVRIEHYHCNNGRFADNDFKSACEQARQRLTFCGVNAHFQNGIAEKAIRDLSESARKQLLHAHQRWPAAVHLALWPYALRNAAHLHNVLPVRDDNTSRLEHFSSIRVGLKLRHAHVFGCPVFALQNELSSGSSLPKWSPWARLGINLGPSPHHARNVSLVLNPHTGCVSPQYHCRFDDFFETVRHSGPDVAIPSTWLQLSGLIRVTNTLSMEEHDDAPLPSQRMRLNHDQPPPTSSTTTVPASISTGLSPADFEDSFSLFDPSDLGLETSSHHTTTPATSRTHHPANPPAPAEPLPPTEAGTSSRGRIRTMSRAMAESVSQRSFFGRGNMHYMASKSVCEHDYAADHDFHLELQERMRHPIAFLSEMMGDTMYLHQALRQPDSRDLTSTATSTVTTGLSLHETMSPTTLKSYPRSGP
jgi:hypothetical protein